MTDLEDDMPAGLCLDFVATQGDDCMSWHGIARMSGALISSSDFAVPFCRCCDICGDTSADGTCNGSVSMTTQQCFRARLLPLTASKSKLATQGGHSTGSFSASGATGCRRTSQNLLHESFDNKGAHWFSHRAVRALDSVIEVP